MLLLAFSTCEGQQQNNKLKCIKGVQGREQVACWRTSTASNDRGLPLLEAGSWDRLWRKLLMGIGKFLDACTALPVRAWSLKCFHSAG
jgi:hypothetical protein